MPILQQPASLSYSPFLALPAPRIAGLLPAPKVEPPPAPFVYNDPRLAALSDKTRADLDKLVTTLLKATVGLLADDLNEAEFAIANGTFLRQVKVLYRGAAIGDTPFSTSPFSHARQRLDEKIEGMLAQSKAHLTETRERITQELASLHAADGER